jgi:hypothetical protein
LPSTADAGKADLAYWPADQPQWLSVIGMLACRVPYRRLGAAALVRAQAERGPQISQFGTGGCTRRCAEYCVIRALRPWADPVMEIHLASRHQLALWPF